MNDKLYRRLFGETKAEVHKRHNAVASKASDRYKVQKSRLGEGFEVVCNRGRVVARFFDCIEDAQSWADENQAGRLD